MKKIVIISPVKNVERVRDTFGAVITDKSIQLEFKGIERGMGGVATHFEKVLIAPEILRLAYQAQQDGAAAVIINCLFGPALEAAKELLSIPVVGILEVVLQTIKQAKQRFSLLLPNFHNNYLQVLKAAVAHHGAANLAASYYQIDLEESEAKQESAIAAAIKEAVLSQQVQMLILSSSYLAKYQDYTQKIVDTLNEEVAILLPLAASIHYIEKVFNGTQSYDRGNLLPPDPQKVEQWYKELKLLS